MEKRLNLSSHLDKYCELHVIHNVCQKQTREILSPMENNFTKIPYEMRIENVKKK